MRSHDPTSSRRTLAPVQPAARLLVALLAFTASALLLIAVLGLFQQAAAAPANHPPPAGSPTARSLR